MFGSSPRGANAYATVGIETGVASASPHKLILMLYDGAQVAITNAQQQMIAGNIAERGKSISKAILIIDSGLRASLDKNVGGEIAENLDVLYEYMSNRLVQANRNNQPELLEEVYNLLLQLKSAWEAIADTGNVPAQAPEVPEPQAYDPLTPRTSSIARA